MLDTGIDVRNPDLAGRIWTNPNPYGDPGYYGDVHGWNFVTNTNDVQDNNSHGTHVSGVIGAWSNNGVGVAGINWNAQIMPVKILDANGNGTTDAAVAGIYFAVNHGARVINASWGGGDYSQAMIDALNYADSRGVVFVTAAGNGNSQTNIGANNDSVPTYPASYRLPNEIVVAAVDQAGNLASFSNYGPNTVDLAAPGVSILSTVPGGYASFSGTSMATSYVTGVVSLLVGLHPDWSAPQLVHQVLANVKPLPGLAGRVITGGMVDAYNAVANVVTYVNGTLNVIPAPVVVPPVVVPPMTVLTVSLQRFRVPRRKTTTVIVLQLSGAVNQGAAQNPRIYNLATVPLGRRRRIVPVPVSRALYNGAQDTITLFPSRPLSLNPPLQLRIVATELPDALGRPLDGNHDGQPGGDFLATLTNRGISIAQFRVGAGPALSCACPRSAPEAGSDPLALSTFASSHQVRRERWSSTRSVGLSAALQRNETRESFSRSRSLRGGLVFAWETRAPPSGRHRLARRSVPG